MSSRAAAAFGDRSRPPEIDLNRLSGHCMEGRNETNKGVEIQTHTPASSSYACVRVCVLCVLLCLPPPR